MNTEQARAFAEQWAADWSRRDAEAILKHYTDDVVFVSQKAGVIVGNPRVVGKQALRTYWLAAVAKIQSIQFVLDDAAWDDSRRVLTVVYQSDLGGAKTRAAEIMRFDEHDRIVSGEAFYGAAL